MRRLYSFLSADKKKTYCLYEAPNPEAIREAARRADVPADVIVEVSQYTYFTEALDLHRRLAMPVWIAHSLADRAAFLSRLGDREHARPLVTEARYLAERQELAAITAQLDLIA